eukprot:UN31389
MASNKSPGALCKKLKKNLVRLNSKDEDESEMAAGLLDEDIKLIVIMLLGEPENPVKEENANEIMKTFLTTDPSLAGKVNLITMFVSCANKLNNESQNNISKIVCRIIGKSNLKDPLKVYKPMIEYLLRGYNDEAKLRVQIQMATVMREMFKLDVLHSYLLNHTNLRVRLFSKVQQKDFDVSSDAFTTLRDLLTKNKKVVKTYLRENYEDVFTDYNSLIVSDNYVTVRQSLKLLQDVLLDKNNKTIMMKYIGSKENLKRLMIILRKKQKAITFEAFHVFKVFVANPNQTPEVYRTLWNNKSRLIKFLGGNF